MKKIIKFIFINFVLAFIFILISCGDSFDENLKYFNVSDDGKTIESVNDYGKSQTNIIIPDGVKNLGDGAFSWCTSLESIVIPSSITSIGSNAFNSCNALKDVYYDGTISNWCNITFNDMISTPMYYAKNIYILDENGDIEYNNKNYTKPTEIIISGKTKINNYAFYNFTSLLSVTIENNVTDIGYYAFRNCTSLISITIPNSVERIRSAAFESCRSLTNIVIPNGVTTIEDRLFDHCISLKKVEIPSSVKTIDIAAFNCCSSLISITIPNSVEKIESNAFGDCVRLVEVVNESSLNITKGSRNYGDVAYYAKQVIVDESKTKLSLDSNGFITYDDGVDLWLVNYLGNNNEIVIPNTITKINDYAFYNYTTMTSITIPNSVTSIGCGAFRNCTSLKNFTIPNSVTSIGNLAFSDCSSLTSMEIPSSVTIIGRETFYGCKSLQNITIPNSITEIGEAAFFYCNSLKNVYYDGTIEDWCNVSVGFNASPMDFASNFYILDSNGEIEYSGKKYSKPIKIIIPDNMIQIDSYQFSGFNQIISVEIPSSVTKIQQEAFYNCYRLAVIINKSELKLTLQSPEHGYVAYYAKQIITDESESNIIIDDNGFITQNDEGDTWLVNYLGDNNEIIIPNTITKISDKVFYNNRTITSVEIPSSITNIGNLVFQNCTSLKKVYYDGTIEKWSNIEFSGIYSNPMYYATNFYILDENGDIEYKGKKYSKPTEIVVPNTLSKIEFQFYGFNQLTSVEIPSNVKSIEGSYGKCTSLTNVYYDGTIEEWCNIVFVVPESNPMYYATNFFILDSNGVIEHERKKYSKPIEIIIPNTVTKIGSYQFCKFNQLINISIPSSVKSIGVNALYGCDLTKLVLPNSLKNIESAAFSGNTLTKIYYEGTSPYNASMLIGTDNEVLTNATWYYYTLNGANEIDSGNWWYYDTDGVTIIEKII